MTNPAVTPGMMVVVPAAPQWGVCRFERVVDSDGAPGASGPTEQQARLFRYDTGDFVVVAFADFEPCPPGVWDKHQPPAHNTK